MFWQQINDASCEVGDDGDRFLAKWKDAHGHEHASIYVLYKSVFHRSDPDAPPFFKCDGWLPIDAVIKALNGDILDDQDGVSVCASCCRLPCQCA